MTQKKKVDSIYRKDIKVPKAVKAGGIRCPNCFQVKQFIIHAYAEMEIEQDGKGERAREGKIRFTDIADEDTIRYECWRCTEFFRPTMEKGDPDPPPELSIAGRMGLAEEGRGRLRESEDGESVSPHQKSLREVLYELDSVRSGDSSELPYGFRLGDGAKLYSHHSGKLDVRIGSRLGRSMDARSRKLHEGDLGPAPFGDHAQRDVRRGKAGGERD